MAQGQVGGKKETDAPTRTELFHVSRVGMNGAAETRETLMGIYETVSAEYNEKIKAEQSSSPQLYRGDRVRLLRDLDSKGANGGHFFLVAYQGGPKVFEVVGSVDGFEAGKLSPPLQIGEADGEHPVEITRTITVKDPAQTEVVLETVDDDDDGAVTFFGIPIPGTSKKKSSGGEPKTGGGNSGGSGSRRQEVTETKSLPLFAASISKVRLDGGPEEMSTPLFVSQLKNGEVFTITRPELRRCQSCRGFGRITTTKPPGFRDPDGKMECPECKAIGKINWQVTYKVVW
ncbi:MAG: hypothetical protein KDN20_06270 [Verrucomicrobiae bacterium]|nr:hypothetical protein [Verrucomicrobiae bacterium]